MFRNSIFDKMLDQATLNHQLEIKWDNVLPLCDSIRQGDTSPKEAVKKIMKKINNQNQHTSKFGLEVLDACVKNCSHLIQSEISTKDFMEQYKEFIVTCSHQSLKIKALGMLQNWAHAFRKISKYRAVNDTMNILKHEGYTFPEFKESEAMFEAEIAPEWKEGDKCHRCRTDFSIMNRKHHCRNCGQVFCSTCTPHFVILPNLGFEKAVRVCIACDDKIKTTPSGSSKLNQPYPKNVVNDSPKTVQHDPYSKMKRRSHHKNRKSSPSCSRTTPKAGNSSKKEELPSEYLNSELSKQNQNPPPKKSEQELKEEEDLQLAIAMSESEMESKRKQTSSSYRFKAAQQAPFPPQKSNQEPDNEDPEMARYLNRSYWDSKSAVTTAGINRGESDINDPTTKKQPHYSSVNFGVPIKEANKDKEDIEIDDFMSMLRGQVEIFINRMKSNASRGRSISNDTTVQSLFMNITAMHSKLLKHIQEQDDRRVYYEGLQDKITQLKDARAALNALREEHQERLRREAELAERKRQAQLAQKLVTMRQQKQEFLEYQRQLALEQVRNQEREMQIRLEQQKQQLQNRAMGGPYSTGPFMMPGEGVGSAFEPVTQMNMNIPPYGQQHPHYTIQGQQGTYMAPPSHTQPTMMMMQEHLSANGTYNNSTNVPAASVIPSNQNTQHIPLGPAATGARYGPRPSHHPPMLNDASYAQQPQSVHQIDPQNSQMINRVDPAGVNVMGPPSSILHSTLGRPHMSSSPLSSPSSSSEHSVIHHGGIQPMPSAPSANSTPLPEEPKEEVAELISFE